MTTLAPGMVFAGDYRVVRPLSAGGMGAVYVVEQLSTRKQRALKLMHPQLAADEPARRRFEQEARVGSQVPSDHVVEVTAAGVDAVSGAPFLVMELLEGEDLEATLRRQHRLAPVEVARVMEQICHAVGAAHAAGIVHRDLKPGNVFLAAARRTDATFTVKVLDFGIAKLVSERTTETAAVGSPMWLAPEQTERRQVTPAADVWALGLIAYTLLTGRSYWVTAAHADASLMHLMREVLFDPLPPASVRARQQGADVPPGFDPWFARCVVRDPGARYQNAHQLFADLAPILGYQRSGYVVGSVTPPAFVPSSAGPAPYVTRYESQAVGQSSMASAVSGTGAGATFSPPPARSGAAGGVLALGCAGTAVVGSLLVAALALTGVALFWNSSATPAAPTAPAGAAEASAGAPVDPAQPPGEDPKGPTDSADSTDEGVGTSIAIQDDEPTNGTGKTGSTSPPVNGAPPTTAPPTTAPPTTTSTRKAKVSSLLGGNNVAGLPSDGQSIIRSLEPRFKACYERGIAGDNEEHFGESMILYLHIDASGGLSSVETRIDSAPPGVGVCILPIIRSVRFSPPPAGPVQGNLIISFQTE